MNIKLISKLSLALCAALVVGSAFAQKPPAGAKGPGAPGRPGAPGGMRGPQGPGGPGGMRVRFMDQMAKDLALTAAQKTKVEALFKAQRAKREADRKANAGKPMDPKAGMAMFKKAQAEMDAGMKKILTAAQWKKYQALQAKRRAEMEKRMKAGGPGMMGGRGGGLTIPGKGGH